MMNFMKFGDSCDFKQHNRKKRLQLVILALFCCLVLVQVNYLAAYRVMRFDFSQDRRHSLSPETMAYITRLQDPIEIIVTLSSQVKEPELKALYNDLTRLLGEYVHAGRASGDPKIRVEWVDIYQQRARAEVLMREYHLQKENSIIVVCQNRSHIIAPSDLYRAKNGVIESFNGEAVIMSAILQVINPNPPVVYFVEGHGEMRLEDTSPLRGLSQAASLMRARNMIVRKIDLKTTSRIPEDANAVVIVAPKGPLEPEQVDMLRRYLDQGEGAVLIYLDAMSEHGLEALLEAWGINADPWIVIDTNTMSTTTTGEFVLRRFAQHPITAPLIDYQVTVVGGTMRAVRPLSMPKNEQRTEVIPLIVSSDSSFGVRPSSLQAGKNITIDPIKDLKGSLPLAVVSQRRLAGGLGVELFRGRLVVIGDGSLVNNRSMQLIGNELLFLESLNWLLKREDHLSITPKNIIEYRLNLSAAELLFFGCSILLVVFVLGAIGVFVAWKRRH
jgi:ABC-type uncharacterized transport system involved in gliding motility auxiliary subunit